MNTSYFAVHDLKYALLGVQHLLSIHPNDAHMGI